MPDVQEVQLIICGRRVPTPSALVTAALITANTTAPATYDHEDVQQDLVCAIDHAGSAEHRAVVLSLRGAQAGPLWTAWNDGTEPHALVELPDCPAVRHGEACSEYEGHPGGHSWELVDPPRLHLGNADRTS
jgi:hypothetical protein